MTPIKLRWEKVSNYGEVSKKLTADSLAVWFARCGSAGFNLAFDLFLP